MTAEQKHPISETPESTQGLDTLAAAALVARHVDLNDVWVTRSLAVLHVSPAELQNRDYEWRLMRPKHEYSFDDITRLISVVVRGGAFVPSSKEEATSAPHLQKVTTSRLAEVDVTICLQYRLNKEPPPEDMRETLFGGFAAINGVYNAWPYLREQTQTLTAKMGIVPLILPVYRVPKARPQPAQGPILSGDTEKEG